MEEMTRKNKITVSIIAIGLVLLTILGITYAYFLTRIVGNTNANSISIATADLELKYFDGNGYLRFDDVMPGTTVEKTFSVKNTGDTTVDRYAVVLEELINTLNRTEDLTYALTCTQKNASGTIEDSCSGISGEFPQENTILLTNSIKPEYTHEYSLKVTYVNLDNVDQSIDMGSNIEAKVQIYNLRDVVNITGTVANSSDGDYIEINSNKKISQIKNGIYNLIGVEMGEHTLKVVNKDNEVVASKKINVKKGPEASVTEELITVTETQNVITIDIDVLTQDYTMSSIIKDYNPYNEGTLAHAIYANKALVEDYNSEGNSVGVILNKDIKMLQAQIVDAAIDAEQSGIFTSNDNNGTSYVYRGTIRNNYVDFAGFTWRIVRINGDSTIRIILDGNIDKICGQINSTVCTLSVFNELSDDNAYVGYMYGLAGSTTDENRCLKLDEANNVVNVISNYPVKETCESNGGTWTTTAYEATHANIKSSTIKEKVDSFYETFIQSYNDYLADSLFCGDKTLYSGYEGIGNKITTYNAHVRLYYKRKLPTLECYGEYSRYKVSENLTYPIGLLNADELMMAGAFDSVGNNTYYLYNSLTVPKAWKTITPNRFTGVKESEELAADTFMGSLNNQFSINDYYVNSESGVRPVINLRSDILLDVGDGTIDNMYKVKLPS